MCILPNKMIGTINGAFAGTIQVIDTVNLSEHGLPTWKTLAECADTPNAIKAIKKALPAQYRKSVLWIKTAEGRRAI